MAENIVDSLFGPSPWQVQQARQAEQQKYAAQLAGMNNIQQAKFGIAQGAGQLAQAGAGMLGMVDPAVEQSRQREAVMASGGDLSTSAGLKAKAAQFAAAGDQQTAMKLVLAARNMEAQERKAQMDAAEMRLKDARSERELAVAEKALTGEAEMKYMHQVQKLIAARDALPEGHPNRAVLNDAIRKETMSSIDQKTLLSEIVDPKDPSRMIRIDANKYQGGSLGDAGVIGVSGKEPLAAKKEEQVGQGRDTVSSLVSTLKDYYDGLLKGGGIVSTKRGPMANIMSRTGSTAVGQAAGGAIGTKNQELRDSIKQQRPLLLQAIKQATGMSAKQMDSNVELKMYLAAATDPEIGYEANMSALQKLDELYGLSGGKAKPQEAPKYEARTPAEVRALYKAGRIPKEDAKAILQDMESRGLF